MKKYTLAALQLGYLELTMKDQEDNGCMYCWESKCDCNTTSVKDDAFLNFSGEELYAI